MPDIYCITSQFLDTVPFKYSFLCFKKLRNFNAYEDVSVIPGPFQYIFVCKVCSVGKSITLQGGRMISLFHGGVQ